MPVNIRIYNRVEETSRGTSGSDPAALVRTDGIAIRVAKIASDFNDARQAFFVRNQEFLAR
jgi:hypothetical protein